MNGRSAFEFDAGEHIDAERAADHAGGREAPEEAPVDVAMGDVGAAGRRSGEDFRCVGRGRGVRGRHAERQEDGGRGDPVGHAERAIHHLGEETHEKEDQEIFEHGSSRKRPYRIVRRPEKVEGVRG